MDVTTLMFAPQNQSQKQKSHEFKSILLRETFLVFSLEVQKVKNSLCNNKTDMCDVHGETFVFWRCECRSELPENTGSVTEDYPNQTSKLKQHDGWTKDK